MHSDAVLINIRSQGDAEVNPSENCDRPPKSPTSVMTIDQCWICFTFFKTTHEGELRSRGKISNIEFRFLVGKKWKIEERFSGLLFTFQPSQNVTRIVLRLWLTRDRVKCGLKATKGLNWDHNKFWWQMWSASKLAPEVQYKLHFTEIHCLCFFCSVWLQLLEYGPLSVKKSSSLFLKYIAVVLP